MFMWLNILFGHSCLSRHTLLDTFSSISMSLRIVPFSPWTNGHLQKVYFLSIFHCHIEPTLGTWHPFCHFLPILYPNSTLTLGTLGKKKSHVISSSRFPTVISFSKGIGGGGRSTPFYLRCLPTDFHEIFTSCHISCKLSKKYSTCSLRPL